MTPAGWRALQSTFDAVGAAAGACARLSAVSERLVGKKFIENATGDGLLADTDARPMMRLDAFDCQTLIETCMAVALTATPAEAAECLRLIRYRDGEARHDARHTDIQNDFLYHNIRLGTLRNVTARLLDARFAESDAPPSAAKKSPARRARGGEKLPALRRTTTTTTTTAAAKSSPANWLTYLPLNKIFVGDGRLAAAGAAEWGGIFINRPLLDSIPSGSVCALVRGRVIHVGITVQTAAGPRLRHAVRGAAVVREEKMAEYLFMLSRLGLCEGIMCFELGAPPAPGRAR